MKNVGSLAEKHWLIEMSISIGNVMEIVKIGKKLGKLMYFAKFANIFLVPMFFTLQYLGMCTCKQS